MKPPANPPGTPRTFLELYDLFVFDLDGTLIESREDLAASLNHALASLGRPAFDLPTVTGFIGNGARVLIERALGAAGGPELVKEGLDRFLEHYADHCTDRTRLHPRTIEVMEALVSAGKRLTVLTNKPRAMSVKILERLGAARFFVRIDGGDSFPKKPDPAGLLDVIASTGAPADRTLVVGDSAVDVATARAGRASSAGALWGFKPEEFELQPPDHLLSSLDDLLGSAILRPTI